jgi:hypothetical protein
MWAACLKNKLTNCMKNKFILLLFVLNLNTVFCLSQNDTLVKKPNFKFSLSLITGISNMNNCGLSDIDNIGFHIGGDLIIMYKYTGNISYRLYYYGFDRMRYSSWLADKFYGDKGYDCGFKIGYDYSYKRFHSDFSSGLSLLSGFYTEQIIHDLGYSTSYDYVSHNFFTTGLILETNLLYYLEKRKKVGLGISIKSNFNNVLPYYGFFVAMRWNINK